MVEKTAWYPWLIAWYQTKRLAAIALMYTLPVGIFWLTSSLPQDAMGVLLVMMLFIAPAAIVVMMVVMLGKADQQTVRDIHHNELPHTTDVAVWAAIRTLAPRAGLSRPPLLCAQLGVTASVASVRVGDVSAVFHSTGFLSGLRPKQRNAVLGHEIAHIAANDTKKHHLGAVVELVLAFWASVCIAITLCSSTLVMRGLEVLMQPWEWECILITTFGIVVTRGVAEFLLKASSRASEHLADIHGCLINHAMSPEELIDALYDISRIQLAHAAMVDDGKVLAPWWAQSHPSVEHRARVVRWVLRFNPHT